MHYLNLLCKQNQFCWSKTNQTSNLNQSLGCQSVAIKVILIMSYTE